jgi:DNA-binding ferritin-like protein
MLSQIDDELTVQPAMDMIRELLDDGEKILKVLDMVYDLSEGARQFGISNFLAERIDAHQKHNWMLRATLS